MEKASVGARILERLDGLAEALKKREAVSDRFTRRRVVLNLNTTPYNPDLVKETRKILGASQGIFAQFLGVSVKTIRSWEQGKNTPSDLACRFMDEIGANPKYWLDRFIGALITK